MIKEVFTRIRMKIGRRRKDGSKDDLTREWLRKEYGDRAADDFLLRESILGALEASDHAVVYPLSEGEKVAKGGSEGK